VYRFREGEEKKVKVKKVSKVLEFGGVGENEW
jgi:hypothetical protein